MSKDFTDLPPKPLSIPVGFLIELSETNDQQDVLTAFARWVKLILDCGRIIILIPGERDHLNRILVEDNQIVQTGETTALYGTTLGMLYRQGRSEIYADLSLLKTPDGELVSQSGFASSVIAPITFGGRCLGLLVSAYHETKPTLDEDLVVLESMGRCLASYMILHDQLCELSQLALTDALTKVHNRRYFQQVSDEVFEDWQKSGEVFSLMICDLDRFKNLNDTYGHDFGDVVLCEVAATMRDVARSDDYVVRMGGEEFCLLMPRTGGEDAMALAEELRSRIQALDLRCEGQSVPVTTSVGVGVVSDKHESVRAVTIAADLALYEAKDSGRNKVAQAV